MAMVHVQDAQQRIANLKGQRLKVKSRPGARSQVFRNRQTAPRWLGRNAVMDY